MPNVNDITRESWILDTFPEWGTWLNEEIENTNVEANTFTMWWLGNVGIWLKTEGNANLCFDFWVKCGKRAKPAPGAVMRKGHQHKRMIGAEMIQPNLRMSVVPIDPFAVKEMDALFATHEHHDHIDPYVAAAVLQNCGPDVPFVGPQTCVDMWVSWGVPRDRCKVVKPGDTFKIKDAEIVVLESFDRTVLVTAPPEITLKGNPVLDMDKKSVNYLIKTSGGNIYHSGDSHYSNYYAKHGNDYDIHVALGSFGENPRGMTDKMTSVDILRMAECLNTDVVIPVHHDVWTNFQNDTNEILMLWKMKRERLQYKFRPFIWQVGGKYTYPNDKEKIQYNYRRGFEDAFVIDPDLPFKALL